MQRHWKGTRKLPLHLRNKTIVVLVKGRGTCLTQILAKHIVGVPKSGAHSMYSALVEKGNLPCFVHRYLHSFHHPGWHPGTFYERKFQTQRLRACHWMYQNVNFFFRIDSRFHHPIDKRRPLYRKRDKRDKRMFKYQRHVR